MRLTPIRLPRPVRSGFTLVELMIVMILLGLVVGGLVRVLAGQQRFYRSASELMDSRSQVRQAAFLLPADLRAASIAGGDIIAASDSSIDFRTTIGSSVVCTATAGYITMPPLVLSSGQTLTAWRFEPSTSDGMYVYNDGATPKAVDDSWTAFTITDWAPTVGACPIGVPGAVPNSYVGLLDATRDSYVAWVTPNVPATIAVGATVRFTRRVQYALYVAGDGKTYLGLRDCANNVCGAIQPVSGPYRPYSGAGQRNGITFDYFDTDGGPLDPSFGGNLALIARIRVTVRGQTESAVAIPGMAPQQKTDTLTMHVGMRNRT